MEEGTYLFNLVRLILCFIYLVLWFIGDRRNSKDTVQPCRFPENAQIIFPNASSFEIFATKFSWR